MKKALKIVFNVIAWVVLIFALLITILVFSSDKNNGTASLLGYIPLTVESDSMKPTFKKGDLIISKEIDDINSLNSRLTGRQRVSRSDRFHLLHKEPAGKPLWLCPAGVLRLFC